MADESERTTDERAGSLYNTIQELVNTLLPPGAVFKSPTMKQLIKTHLDEHATPVYEERARVLALACFLAEKVPGWKVGIGRHDPEDKSWDPDWTFIVFIEWTDPRREFPSFQASWHVKKDTVHLFAFLPSYDRAWDGHTTKQKYTNIEQMIRGAL